MIYARRTASVPRGDVHNSIITRYYHAITTHTYGQQLMRAEPISMGCFSPYESTCLDAQITKISSLNVQYNIIIQAP